MKLPLTVRCMGKQRPTPIFEACSRDMGRPVLTAAHLVKHGKGKKARWWVEATDSYQAVAIPVDGCDDDVAGLIHAAALKAAARMPDARVSANGDVRVEQEDGSEAHIWSGRPDGTFPNVAGLRPDKLADFSFGVNIDVLGRACKALGADVVRVQFTGDSEGNPDALRTMVVTPGNVPDDGRFALVMPVRLNS